MTITPGSQNDTMRISLHGMPPRTSFDLFVIQQPTKPFGVSWYQTDVNVGRRGSGSATVRGVFDSETFSVSPGGTTTFGPTHQYHLGLWFNNPRVPFRLGCEKGMSTPVVTPSTAGTTRASRYSTPPSSRSTRARCRGYIADRSSGG